MAGPTADTAAIFNAFDNAMMSGLNNLLQSDSPLLLPERESSRFIVVFLVLNSNLFIVT